MRTLCLRDPRVGLSLGRGGLLLLAARILGGCASAATSQAPSANRAELLRMDPILVRSETDPLTGLDGYDASQLLELGNQLYGNADYARAVKVFDRLVTTFPESDLCASALYNAGLSYEQVEEFASALERFQRVLAEHPESTSFKDSHFRVAFALAKLERWQDVADAFWSIRQLSNLTTMDEIEARVGMGVGLFMQGDHATAEREFLAALRFHEERGKEEYLAADYWIGQARFYLGEVYAREFEGIRLNEPDVTKPGWEEMMGNQLEEKCELLLRAQNNFIRAIRVGHAGWATASGYRIGSLYERLYDDMMKVPVPPGLGDEAREYYLGEVRKRVGVLVTKAIKIYEQSLEMATRVGEKNEWVERTSRSLERMKSLYLDSFSG